MDQQSFIYKLLLAPQFRALRYLAVIIFFGIVSLNQALMSYGELFPILGNKIYSIIAATIFIYVGVMLVTIRGFAPILLSKGRYLTFAICILVDALIFTLVPNIVYILFFDKHEFFTVSALIDNLSAFVIYVLCISGVMIPLFLKNWITSNQQLSQLKIKQKSSLVGQLKEQINPSSFFKILSRSEALIKTEPKKASEMLMKLTQLLRYQLYDCNRETVLLTAEISFLNNFLDLEQLHSSKLNYTMTVEDNLTNVFVSPSLLLPYVQSAINALDAEEEKHLIDISVKDSDKSIFVSISILGINSTESLSKELEEVRERFVTLCKDKYQLPMLENPMRLNLQLDKE